MARKREVLPSTSPLLYLAKQTLLLISVLSAKWMGTRQSQRHGVGRIISYGKTRVVFIDPGAKVNSSYYCNSVLEKGLLPDIRTICRHYRWTLQQDGAPAHTDRTTMDYLKKGTSTSLNLTFGIQIALILIPWITLFGVLFGNESTNQWMASTSWSNQERRQTHGAWQLGLSSRTSF